MEEVVPTVVLRVGFGHEAVVEHDILSAGDVSRHEAAIGAATDLPVSLLAPDRGTEKAPYMLAANGSIVELAGADGRFRHEIFVPDGKLTDALLASDIFPVVRRVARIVVLEERPVVDKRRQDPPRLWTTQGSRQRL